MPSKSEKQQRLMAAAAHNPKFAKKVGVPVSVAQEFNQADQKRGVKPSKMGKSKSLSRQSEHWK
jgi:ribosome assembly protein YihI (activator of Der GTPase)